MQDFIKEYRANPNGDNILKDSICQKNIDSWLTSDCEFEEGEKFEIKFTVENLHMFSKHVLNDYFFKVYKYLKIVEQQLFFYGLHPSENILDEQQLKYYLKAYFKDRFLEKER